MTMAEDRRLLVATFVAVATIALAAPGPTLFDEDTAQFRVDVSPTRSPQQAIEEAIRYDPAVAAALRSNNTNLYLLKSITYTNGTTADLGLPSENLLPEGAPDRVQVSDKILYSSSIINISTNEESSTSESSYQHPLNVHATLQLVPVPTN